MSLAERAITAYRDSRAEEKAWEETQAKQFCVQATQWIEKTFGVRDVPDHDEPELIASFAPNTPGQTLGWLGGVRLRVTMPYRRRQLDLCDPCPECGERIGHDLGQALAGDRTNLVNACGCQRKKPPESTAQERLARAFADVVFEIVDDR